MRAVLDAQPDLVNAGAADDGWAVRHADRPLTRFEQRGIEAGRTVRDLHYRRR
jgi:tRNA (guanine-N7-)-methyltransferase